MSSFTETMAGDDGQMPSELISADKVHGTAVYNAGGDRLGSIDSIMIDKASGQVDYVVMSFGGFLGIGEKYHPMPWDMLDYDPSVGGYRVDLDRSDLESAPNYDRDGIDAYDFASDEAGVDDYYAGRGRARMADASILGEDVNRSDLNDGRERPLGYFSSQAQADRSAASPGAHAENDAAGGPGFYSPEQQTSRSVTGGAGGGKVLGPEGAQTPTDYETQVAPDGRRPIDTNN